MPSNRDEVIKWSSEEHPSIELLRQHEEGTLPKEMEHELEKHLLDCELCTDVLEGIALTDRQRTRGNVYKISQRIRTRIRKNRKKTIMHGLSDWRVVVAIVLLFCLLALLVFFYYVRSAPAPQDAEQELIDQNTTDSPEESTAYYR